MAKIKHNNFLDTVDEVFSTAKREGILHLHSEDTNFTGRTIRINGQDLWHFGTTGYLGLEQDERLKRAAVNAIMRYGTQFPLSRTYVSHPLYLELEEKVTAMYQNPVIITKNSTLGHIAVIPTAVRDEDAVILDHQVHWSVQNAAQLLKPRGIPVEMIRHNNLEMLEEKIRSLRDKAAKIWYMADGVYSMYGDFSPVKELVALSQKYEQLHLYFDDVHGMSWKGKNGTGFVMDELGGNLPENVILFGTLSKTFGASGAVFVCANQELQRKIKTYGGPLTFSAQLEPASVAAASASADIHLSSEIYELQKILSSKIAYLNSKLNATELPLIASNSSPVFYIGTGMPITGYDFVRRLMKEGYFINLGLYPAVPVKNTGVRITVSSHNEMKEIGGLVDAMNYHFPLSLEATQTNESRVRRAFGLNVSENATNTFLLNDLKCYSYDSIHEVNKDEWNSKLGRESAYDWEGLVFLEKVFNGAEQPENSWHFSYLIIKDKHNQIVLATFFTKSLWKDDMLAPPSVSKNLEEIRKKEPFHMTSQTLALGCLFTEGSHLYWDRKHKYSKQAFTLLLEFLEKKEQKYNSTMVALRDFLKEDALSPYLCSLGFVPVSMPDSCVLNLSGWNSVDEYINTLSSRSRRHFRKDVAPYTGLFDISVENNVSKESIVQFYELYQNVKNQNFGLNTFTYPLELFSAMAEDTNWEFITLRLKGEIYAPEKGRLVGVMFCYKNLNHTYSPSLVGMDYNYSHEFQVYRQLLFQTVLRAKVLEFKKVDFGFSASFEKRKFGATIIEKQAFIQAKDNYSLELIGLLQNESR
ncbi:MAG: bifunctional aminotransferase class I/II-fold pyridoxal phosphate-dependent enzyme/GNAT family N-acetyltransferase [Gillisia sp.]